MSGEKKLIGKTEFRDDMSRQFDWVREGNALYVTDRSNPVVKILVISPVERELMSTLPTLSEEDLRPRQEYLRAVRLHPESTRRVLLALANLDAALAKELAGLAEGLSAEAAEPKQQDARPAPLQLSLPRAAYALPLCLAEAPKEEVVMQPARPMFPKPVSTKKQDPTPIRCDCNQLTLVPHDQRLEYAAGSDEPDNWPGEPGETRLFQCRDCGWALSATRRNGRPGYEFKNPKAKEKAARKPMRTLLQQLQEEAVGK